MLSFLSWTSRCLQLYVTKYVLITIKATNFVITQAVKVYKKAKLQLQIICVDVN
jgi:hypothetical protein